MSEPYLGLFGDSPNLNNSDATSKVFSLLVLALKSSSCTVVNTKQLIVTVQLFFYEIVKRKSSTLAFVITYCC